MEGILLIDKPQGITSHDVINRLRRAIGVKRIGHTGTLDPLATGLLVCCVGRATRLSEYLVRADKTYEGEMTFGAFSDTYDSEGTISESTGNPPESSEDISAAFETLLGDIEQEVPKYSAVKVKGRPLYEHARKGSEVDLPRRIVSIKQLDLHEYKPPCATFYARVSSGTYIRTICHSVGEKLKCGAYMSALRRTRVGYFVIDGSITLEKLERLDKENIAKRLIPLNQALKHLPRIVLTSSGLKKFLNGNNIYLDDIHEFLHPKFGPHLPLQIVDNENFYGIVERKKIFQKPMDQLDLADRNTSEIKSTTYYKPSKVFHPE